MKGSSPNTNRVMSAGHVSLRIATAAAATRVLRVIHALLAILVLPAIRVVKEDRVGLAARDPGEMRRVPPVLTTVLRAETTVLASLGAAVAGVVNFAGDDLPIPEAFHRT